MSSKNKKQSVCSYHPNRPSEIVCNNCGDFVCKDCYVIYKEKHYCIKSCLPSEIVPDSKEIKSQTVPLNQENASEVCKSGLKSNRHILFWAALTLSFCSLSISIWAIREIYLTQKENTALRESRIRLLDNLRKNNQELNKRKDLSPTQSPDLQTKETDRSVKKTVKRIADNFFIPNSSKSISFNNGAIDRKLVALTFDGSAFANCAMHILDTLRSRAVPATLFIAGQFIKQYPEVITAYLNEGFEIGNHTLSHPHLTTYSDNKFQRTLDNISQDKLCSELERNNDLFFKLTGRRFAPLWRAPYGEFNDQICKWAQNCGYIHVGWRQGRTWKSSLDSNDWIPNEDAPGFKTPLEVLQKIVSIADSDPTAMNGGIILMHLGSSRDEPGLQVYTILGALIDSLRTRGYQFVKISEMIREDKIYFESIPSSIQF
jgi:peptidoglycan/xylan/chitin deacetylase (PgdA/CDA1 family)